MCEDCAEKTRVGRDNTTRAAKLGQRSMRAQAAASRAVLNGREVNDQDQYLIASTAMYSIEGFLVDAVPARGAGGEVVPESDLALRDTMLAPNVAALDASAHRVDLVTTLGADVAAMALDTAESISASNSVEKMYSHQLAALHNLALQLICRGTLDADSVNAARMLNLGVRAVEVFQRGAINLSRLRGGQQQLVRVEHVHVAAGAQAIVGNVRAGGKHK